MARLILHIGAHKTATTFLQRCFFLNRNLLEQHGVYYPDIGPNPAHHILTTPWIGNNEIPPAFYGNAGPYGVWERLIADYASRDGTVFLSGEPFSRLQPQRVDMAALAARLSPFEDVRIIYTARRQTELIQAIWLQKMKAKLAGDLGEFLNHACTRFLATGVPVEHGLIYDHVLTGFSPRQVTILDYEHIRHAPGGVLQTFLDLIGVGLKAEQMSRVGARGANISPDPLGMYVYSRIAPNERPDKGELARIVAALKELHSARSTIYTREDYARICRVFAPLNTRFEARVRMHQPDFAMAPEQAEPTFTWRDDLSISDWSRVAAAANPGG
ncbi:hypothetical protein KTN05_12310 [Paracoccus sp. Z118]|uniref:hypothetical protein n=1 Tax=Paracoccus sp. Z118 TaxID=2851017 RepID=UPI001C2BC324|nr:hypothetical protein [Paracoccus sp. Z118]MBV0892631.1 hypothetical protein [Paracoccus sp. Z118]